MNLWQGLRFSYYFVRAAINVKDVRNAVKAGDILARSGTFEPAVEKVRATPGGAEFLASTRYRFKKPLEFYASRPEGSLGRVYFEHLTSNHLDPDAFPEIEIKDDAHYIEHIVRECHDLWHVLTGFDTSVEGEIGLQAFKAQQFNWPFAMAATAVASLLVLFKTPERTGKLIGSIARGWRLGEQCAPVILVDWNQYWDRPVVEVRQMLGLPASQ